MFSRDEKEALYSIQLLSGRSLENTKDVFIGTAVWIAYQYVTKGRITIPLIGDIGINYKGDILKEKGNQAVIDLTVQPSSFLLRLIGQISDGEKTDIEKIFEKNIHNALKQIIEE